MATRSNTCVVSRSRQPFCSGSLFTKDSVVANSNFLLPHSEEVGTDNCQWSPYMVGRQAVHGIAIIPTCRPDTYSDYICEVLGPLPTRLFCMEVESEQNGRLSTRD